MNSVEQMNTVPLNGDLAPDRFLVKFYFTNPDHIPPGIPEKGRKGDAEIDAIHSHLAIVQGMAEEAKVGRIRPGRVDTGAHIVNNLPNVQVATLRQGFARSKYVLVDLHYFRAEAKDKPGTGVKSKPKWVVNCTFARVDSTAGLPELPRKAQEALRELAKTTWGFCHVYLNPDGTSTVNLVGRRWNDSKKAYDAPEHVIAIRKGELAGYPCKQILEEGQE